MRILFDESLPRRIAREVENIGHECRTVAEMGWARTKNEALLRQAVGAGFAVFITVDRNLEYQENVASHSVGVIVLIARSNRTKDLRPLIPEIKVALSLIDFGRVIHAGG